MVVLTHMSQQQVKMCVVYVLCMHMITKCTLHLLSPLQCASHLSLGWRIMVMDPEDTPPSQTVTEGSIPTHHASLWLFLCLASSSLLLVLL